MNTPAIAREDGAIVLRVHVQANAGRDEIAGLHGDRIKLRIAAPALEDRANERICRYLAAQFGVPRARVEIVTGARGRDKRVRIIEPVREPHWLTRFQP